MLQKKISHFTESAVHLLVQRSEPEGTDMASSMVTIRDRIIFNRFGAYPADFLVIALGFKSFRFWLDGSAPSSFSVRRGCRMSRPSPFTSSPVCTPAPSGVASHFLSSSL